MSENDVGNPIGKAILLIAIVGGGWFFLRKYEIVGLDAVTLRPKTSTDQVPDDRLLAEFQRPDAAAPWGASSRQALVAGNQGIPSTLASTRIPKAEADADAEPSEEIDEADIAQAAQQLGPIRVGSWALAGFDRQKLAKPHVMDWFTRVASQFDVLALQQITGRQRDLLPRIVEQMNRTGRHYEFLVGPPVGPHLAVSGSDPGVLSEQYAFLFDTDRIETDRGQLYTVDDPHNSISYDPLVAWFRVRGVPVERAWTFSLVNMRIDTDHASVEVPRLAQVMAAVAADGRGEDDLLLAGMLAADDRQLAKHLGGNACHAAVVATPTDIFGRYQLSNLISPRKTTTENLGHGGVVNFVQVFDLNEAEAEELSPHLPVFAEFTPTEGN